MLAEMSRAALVIALAACAPSCSDPTLSCVEGVDFASCAPLYAPTFENVYANTVERKCSTGGRACHSAAGAQGGLVLEGEERAYRSLTAAARYVTPGAAACSELVERLYADDPSLLMPRGARLADAEACAIGQWVERGAPPPASLVDAGLDAASTAEVSP